MLDDWPGHARRVIAELRGSSSALLGDPRFNAVLARLRRHHPEVRRWWDSHEVGSRVGATKRFRHPVAGILDLEEVVLRPAAAPTMQLVVKIPVPGTGTEERLRRIVADAGVNGRSLPSGRAG
jgi:hypothetical protein